MPKCGVEAFSKLPMLRLCIRTVPTADSWQTRYVVLKGPKRREVQTVQRSV